MVAYDDYYPFGLTMPNRSMVTVDPKWRFTGKEKSPSTGRYLFGARTYKPLIGRWDQVDPIEIESLGWSPYNYAFNNSLKFVDPNGKQSISIYWNFEMWVRILLASQNVEQNLRDWQKDAAGYEKVQTKIYVNERSEEILNNIKNNEITEFPMKPLQLIPTNSVSDHVYLSASFGKETLIQNVGLWKSYSITNSG